MDNTLFDLLALPQVAIQTCFSFMPPTHLLVLSHTSKRCKDLIKGIKLKVVLRENDNEIDVWYSQNQWETFKIEKEDVKIDRKGWKMSVNEFTRLFGRISGICMTTRNFEESWKWINKDHNGLKELELMVKSTEDPHEVMKMIVDNVELKQLEKLSFFREVSKPFKYTDPFTFESSLKTLTIWDSSWFTVQNLMDCQVEKCHLLQSELTDQEINLILKNWKNQVDALKNLKLFSLYRGANTTHTKVVLAGLQRENEFHREHQSFFELTYDDQFYLEVAVYGNYLCAEKRPRIDPFH